MQNCLHSFALLIRDLKSVNGVVVNGTRVTHAELHAGDVVVVGPGRHITMGSKHRSDAPVSSMKDATDVVLGCVLSMTR